MMQHMNRYEQLESSGAYLSANTVVADENPLLAQMVRQACIKETEQDSYTAIQFHDTVSDSMKDHLKATFGDVYIESDDGYVIELSREIHIFATSIRGLVYGAYTLQQLAGIDGYVQSGLIYNVPLVPFRGLKVYLPAEEDIDFFKSFIDMACYYRYNTITIEVGGAMEYRRHPEINEGWIEYCAEMHKYSGRSMEIQNGFNWSKNSIHSENGGGKWLTQETVKALVAYCKQRGLNVIPEVPCLSHSDYLLTRHPELAERQDDPYPDTYCPSNPASYELLFDVLDEVADVFEPEVIHVGHDEYYSIGLCDRCKGKDAANIFAEDLNKIDVYLQNKGISTMIWGDKLIDGSSKLGYPVGGAERPIHKNGEYLYTIPPTYQAIDMIPNRIQIMHWYWSIQQKYDAEFLQRDLFLVFGNFSGPGVPEWSRRVSSGVQGASISNWSALREEYLQRNAIFFNMAYCCHIFWKEGYDESMFISVAEEAFEDIFRYKNREILKKSHIEIIHATTSKRNYEGFYDGKFIVPEQDWIGQYKLTFDDGSVFTYPLQYGVNITCCDVSWEYSLSPKYDVLLGDPLLQEVSYTSQPLRDGARTFYKIVFEHPASGRNISRIEFVPAPHFTDQVIIQQCNVVS